MGYGILPRGGFNTLLGSEPLSIPLASIWGHDGVSHNYRFKVYNIAACPFGVNGVYIFGRLEGSTYVPVYVGRAEQLNRRLTDHERRDEAIRHGALFLLVHIPGPLDPIVYEEAERRLIQRYTPILNEKFNPSAALFARQKAP